MEFFNILMYLQNFENIESPEIQGLDVYPSNSCDFETLKLTLKFFETFDTYRNFKEPKSFITLKDFKRSKVRTQDSRFKICQGLRKFQLSNHVRGDSNFPCHVWMFDTIPNVSARIATCSMKGHCQRERAWSCVHTFNTVTFTDREPRWLRKSRSSAASFFC